MVSGTIRVPMVSVTILPKNHPTVRILNVRSRGNDSSFKLTVSSQSLFSTHLCHYYCVHGLSATSGPLALA
jgi:hypothetical protein